MGHAMHTVRMEEKRRSREEEEDAGGGGKEEDKGGGERGGGGRNKQGRSAEKDEGKERDEGSSAGRVRLRGALLKTYILSILIRTILEVKLY